MKELVRTQVDRFKLNDAYTLEDLEKNEKNIKIIPIEDIFYNNDSIVLEENKQDEIVKVYSIENKFIGTGIINNNILKRDIII